MGTQKKNHKKNSVKAKKAKPTILRIHKNKMYQLAHAAFAENPNIEKQVHKSLIKAQAGEDTNEEIMPGVRMQFDATAS